MSNACVCVCVCVCVCARAHARVCLYVPKEGESDTSEKGCREHSPNVARRPRTVGLF